MATISLHLQKILSALPLQAGVYRFYDHKNQLIYVGKAKQLKKRVRSYFTGRHTGKTKLLVEKIVDIQFIVVPTEQDALLLENSLIKEFQPPYNILLKDDKSYPWICIKKEPFPRVFSTRNVVRDGSVYFGPYTSVKMVNTLLDLISQLFPLRNCNLNLNSTNIQAKKFSVCLEYHLGNCKGPCVGEENVDTYAEKIDQIKNILKGNINGVKQWLKHKMIEQSEQLFFEQAQALKVSLQQIESYQSKSTVVSTSISNVDVFGIFEYKNRFFVNYFKVIDGAIIQSHTAEAKIKLNESKEDVLMHYIISIRAEYNSQSREVLIPYHIGNQFTNFRFIVPKIGDKKKLIELSVRNAKLYGLDKSKMETTPEIPNQRVLEELKKRLHLSKLPRHIECFDNSNIQGTNPVSACVVFKDAKPSKSEYRHFIIKTVIGPDDYASMREVINRRYTRLVKENRTMPDLIIIDGGKGQLSAAINALEAIDLSDKIPIIGIAKRLEEIFFPGDQFPIYIDKKSEALKLIQFMRNEAHRFGIQHHRKRREITMIESELDNIPGIGLKTRRKLLKEFKSVEKIKKANLSDIQSVIGVKKANIVVEYLKK